MNENGHSDKPRVPRATPASIGPYRILDVLGEGGMATVYLAAQSEPVKRKVALKILKAGMDSRQVLARFESERQALAVLDHPNIAKIFDGGIAENGRPYFVMELVRGVPITRYCDDQRLSNAERIALFIDVCAAVQHAHHKGLIHRDLKPSNILVTVVDGKPLPKIIDFGIAKATTAPLTEATLYTRIGQIVGTPQYMSPEQAGVTGVDVDTRTDIYSLGVILYELLVGAVPLDLVAIGDQAMKVALSERDPPRPSTRFTSLGDTQDEVARVRSTDPDHLRRELKGDLDWVVMRSIEKDRTRRYETVNALSMECRRFLKHEPVLARPPSPGYLMKRFVQRNRVIVAAGVIAALAVIAGATAATLGYLRATQAEKVALQEAKTSREISDFLIDLFEVSDPSEARGNSITAREVLDRGTAGIDAELADQPRIQTVLMLKMAKVYENLGLLDTAGSLLTRALAIRRNSPTPEPLAVAEVLNQLGEVQILQGDFDGAKQSGEEALEIRRSRHGKYHADVGHTLSVLATVDYYRADYDSALQKFSESLDILERTLGVDNEETIKAMSSLGSLYWRAGSLEEAERLQRVALERLRAKEGDDHPDVAVIMNNLAILLGQLGKAEEAEPYYLDSLEIQRKVLGKHPLVANSMNNVGMFYMRQGELEKSELMLSGALEMWSETLGPESLKVFTAHKNLAELYIEMAEYDAAERHIEVAIAGNRDALGDDHERVALSVLVLCDLYNLTERYTECNALIGNAIHALEEIFPDGHSRIAAARIREAMSLAGMGRFEEAESLMLSAYSVYEQTASGGASERRDRRWVARFYELWGKPEDAARYQD